MAKRQRKTIQPKSVRSDAHTPGAPDGVTPDPQVGAAQTRAILLVTVHGEKVRDSNIPTPDGKTPEVVLWGSRVFRLVDQAAKTKPTRAVRAFLETAPSGAVYAEAFTAAALPLFMVDHPRAKGSALRDVILGLPDDVAPRKILPFTEAPTVVVAGQKFFTGPKDPNADPLIYEEATHHVLV